jgi:hypothetical protein
MAKAYAIVLGILAAAFLLRVCGQLLVAFFGVTFLPPMSQWYSGLVPYAVLLPIQIVILLLQAKVSLDIWRSNGFFARRRPYAGRALCWFSYIYFIAMVVRYVLTMYLYPQRRWFAGTIPIFFHWVLAAYLFVLGRYHRSVERKRPMEHRHV